MEQTPQPDQSSAPKPARPPVMDIKAPPRPSAPEPVKTPPPEAGKAEPESVELKKADKRAPKPPKPPKTRGSGVGLAVFATIVIVLGLGALFVYAYLRTQGISIF